MAKTPKYIVLNISIQPRIKRTIVYKHKEMGKAIADAGSLTRRLYAKAKRMRVPFVPLEECLDQYGSYNETSLGVSVWLDEATKG